MMAPGDWRKLEEQINSVLIPMGERLAALEERLEAFEEAQKPKTGRKGAPTGQKADSKEAA